MSTQLKPRGGLVLLKQHTASEKKTSGGIVLPLNVVQNGFAYATVLAVGPGAVLESGQRSPIDLEVGDTVIFQSLKAIPMSVSGDKTFLTDQGFIMAVVPEGSVEYEAMPGLPRPPLKIARA